MPGVCYFRTTIIKSLSLPVSSDSYVSQWISCRVDPNYDAYRRQELLIKSCIGHKYVYVYEVRCHSVAVVRCMECSPESMVLQMPGSLAQECTGASVAIVGVSTRELWSLCVWHQWVPASWVAECRRPWEVLSGLRECGHESTLRVAWGAFVKRYQRTASSAGILASQSEMPTHQECFGVGQFVWETPPDWP